MAAKKGPGRKTLLDEERARIITEALENGVAAKHAVRAADIDESTYYNWLRRGREERDRQVAGLDPNENESQYLQFVQSVEKAEAVGATRHMENISQNALNGTWQASAWILERRFPHEYGRLERQEISGPEGGPLRIDVSTEEIMRKARQILEQRGKA